MFLLPLISFGQINKDSLWAVWNDQSQHDTIRLSAIHDLAWKDYKYTNPDSAHILLLQHYDYAKKNGIYKEMAKALCTRAKVYRHQGKHSAAIKYFDRSLTISKKNNDLKAVANTLSSKGVVFKIEGDYVRAIECYTKSLSIAEANDYKEEMAIALGNTGNIYKQLKDYPKAIELLSRCLVLKEELEDQRGIARTLNNLGNICLHQRDFDAALKNYSQCLAINQEIKNEKGIATALGNIGGVYFTQGDYEKAIDNQLQSLKIKKRVGDKIGIIYASFFLGKTYGAKKNYSKAIEYLESALNLAKEFGAKDAVGEAAFGLYTTCKSQNRTALALEMLELYVQINDSLSSENNRNEIIRYEVKYQYEKQHLSDSLIKAQEKKLDDISQQQQLMHQAEQRNYIIIAACLIFLILGIFIRLRVLKQQKEKESLIQEVKLLKANTIIKLMVPSKQDRKLEGLGLDKEKIESSISAKLNNTDWNILNQLFENPIATNKEIAELVSLSFEGVRSSLKKMYRIFDIGKSGENQKISLIITVTHISNGTTN